MVLWWPLQIKSFCTWVHVYIHVCMYLYVDWYLLVLNFVERDLVASRSLWGSRVSTISRTTTGEPPMDYECTHVCNKKHTPSLHIYMYIRSTLYIHTYVCTCIWMHACMYVHVCIINYRARLDELKIFLETEAWELCPVRSTFSLHQLRVCMILHVFCACTHWNFCFTPMSCMHLRESIVKRLRCGTDIKIEKW